MEYETYKRANVGRNQSQLKVCLEVIGPLMLYKLSYARGMLCPRMRCFCLSI